MKLVRFSIVAFVFALGCSKEPVVERDDYVFEPVKAACRMIAKLENPTAATNAVVVKELDVRGLSAKDFKRELLAMPGGEVHLWAPGKQHWLLVGRIATNRVSLAQAMETLAMENECESLPQLFAGYVGTRDEIMPAFRSRLEGEVVPEWFLTKDVPQLEWLDVSGIDGDILQGTLSEIRSMQVVRRLVLEGDIEAAKIQDKKGEEKATEIWARAALRNPRDLYLLERVDRLERNAGGFLAVGKLLQAMKCYETIILIQPKNAAAIHNFGMCLKKIGKLDLAEKVLERAEKLKQLESGAAAGAVSRAGNAPFD